MGIADFTVAGAEAADAVIEYRAGRMSLEEAERRLNRFLTWDELKNEDLANVIEFGSKAVLGTAFGGALGFGPVGSGATFGAGSAALEGGDLEDIIKGGLTGGGRAMAGDALFGGGVPADFGSASAGATGTGDDMFDWLEGIGDSFEGFSTDPSLADLGGDTSFWSGGGGDDWWTELGLTAEDVGMASNPFTTDPSLRDLGGEIDPATGLPSRSTLENLLSKGGDLLKNPALRALLRGVPGGLGAIGSNRQAKSLEALQREWMALGAPSRGRFESSFAPGFSMANEPGYKDALDQTTKSFLHKASIAGNPADSPNAWKQTLADVNAGFAYPALQNYRSLNANAGGLASFAPAAQEAAGTAIGAQGRVFSDLGGAAGDIFSPPDDGLKKLADLLRRK